MRNIEVFGDSVNGFPLPSGVHEVEALRNGWFSIPKGSEVIIPESGDPIDPIWQEFLDQYTNDAPSTHASFVEYSVNDLTLSGITKTVIDDSTESVIGKNGRWAGFVNAFGTAMMLRRLRNQDPFVNELSPMILTILPLDLHDSKYRSITEKQLSTLRGLSGDFDQILEDWFNDQYQTLVKYGADELEAEDFIDEATYGVGIAADVISLQHQFDLL